MEGLKGGKERHSVKPKLPVKRVRKSLSEKAKIAKRESDRLRAKNRVNIGSAHGVWKKLRDENGFRTDAEMAFFLINIYLQARSQDQSISHGLNKTSLTDGCESVHYEYQVAMSSPSEDEEETCAASSVESSENIKCVKKDLGKKEKRDIQPVEDEQFSTSLIVGDGLHLVDLGSSSEFIVDEECILKLFKLCRECNRQCSVRKQVKGLQLVVYQACRYCNNRFKWTNLPDDSNSVQLNGKNATHGQNNLAVVQSKN
ncbi:uncharacterized protein LOC117816427 [Xyrichtys novacula]|uniref:Uncharacterized protein LOC117816427 n=1 Tax=Xyrichtys novacula TaxID=13765 RepID=A0AAV1EYC2_XYRNO|nr:uncharacterized protein LOC117816427 [Xyrichtys novacula]